MLSERKMKNAVKKYNDIMIQMGLDHNTIGTRLSERTEEWNLRDMVSECQYQLDCFSEEGHSSYEALHELDYDEMTIDDLMDKQKFRTHMARVNAVEQAKKDMKSLREFINRYKKDISGMECHQGHCSMWD